MALIVSGNFLMPSNSMKMDFFEGKAAVVSDSGHIKGFRQKNSLLSQQKRALHDFGDSILVPCFTDLHTHLAQFKAMGKYSGNLLKWLKKIYSFEARLEENDFAEENASAFFNSMLSNGTANALLYSSVHKKATDIAFRTALKTNSYIGIGKMMMDTNCPDFLMEKTRQSLKDSLALHKKWNGKKKLSYVFAPRFAVACSKNLLKGLGVIKRKMNPLIQTHLSETKNEINEALKIHPYAENYADIYAKAGLLGSRTFFGHGIHLSKKEISSLKGSNSRIVYCPHSNENLGSGKMPAKKYLKDGLVFGLGTDIAGSPSLSMFDTIRSSLRTSKSGLSAEQLLWIATLGNAKLMGIDSKTGSFAKGKEATFFALKNKSESDSKNKIISYVSKKCNSKSIQSVFVQGKEFKNN